MNKPRPRRDLPPTLAVVLIILLVLAFAALLFALGLRAGGISVGVLGGLFAGVVAILRAARHLLPPGRGEEDADSAPRSPASDPDPPPAGGIAPGSAPPISPPSPASPDPVGADPIDPPGIRPFDPGPDATTGDHDPAALSS